MGRHGGKAPEAPKPEQERLGVAGQPAHYRETTIDPVGGDGPPTEAYTALDAPDDHEARPTEGYQVPTPIADQVPRTGFGSANKRPRPGPIARLVLRQQRLRRVALVAFTVTLLGAAVPLSLIAGEFLWTAYQHRDDLTEMPQSTLSPLLALTACAMLLIVALLVVMWRDKIR